MGPTHPLQALGAQGHLLERCKAIALAVDSIVEAKLYEKLVPDAERHMKAAA